MPKNTAKQRSTSTMARRRGVRMLALPGRALRWSPCPPWL